MVPWCRLQTGKDANPASRVPARLSRRQFQHQPQETGAPSATRRQMVGGSPRCAPALLARGSLVLCHWPAYDPATSSQYFAQNFRARAAGRLAETLERGEGAKGRSLSLPWGRSNVRRGGWAQQSGSHSHQSGVIRGKAVGRCTWKLQADSVTPPKVQGVERSGGWW